MGSIFTNIRIYRNIDGQPSNFYLVDEVPAGTTSYIDSKPDADIDNPANLLDRNGPPVNTALHSSTFRTFDGTNYVNLFEAGTLQFTGSKGADGGLDLATKELDDHEHDNRARSDQLHAGSARHSDDVTRSG